MLSQSSFTIFCLVQKAVMYAAQDFVFISPRTMDPGSKCWHGNCEVQDGGDGAGDLWWLVGDFFVIIVLYIMSFIRIAGHCNTCQWSYF